MASASSGSKPRYDSDAALAAALGSMETEAHGGGASLPPQVTYSVMAGSPDDDAVAVGRQYMARSSVKSKSALRMAGMSMASAASSSVDSSVAIDDDGIKHIESFTPWVEPRPSAAGVVPQPVYGASARGPEGAVPQPSPSLSAQGSEPQPDFQPPIWEATADMEFPDMHKNLARVCHRKMAEHKAVKYCCCDWMDLHTAVLVVAIHFFVTGCISLIYFTVISVLVALFFWTVTGSFFVNYKKDRFKLGPVVWLGLIVLVSAGWTLALCFRHPKSGALPLWLIYFPINVYELYLTHQWIAVVKDSHYDLNLEVHHFHCF